MRHIALTATLLSFFAGSAVAQQVITGPVTGAARGATAGAATGAAVAGPVGAAVGAPIGAATGAAAGAVGAVTAPLTGVPAPAQAAVAGLPPTPPGMCYAVSRRGVLRTDRAGNPRLIRC